MIVEIHNITARRPIYNLNYVCLTTNMQFNKTTFIRVMHYIKFKEFSVWKLFTNIHV